MSLPRDPNDPANHQANHADDGGTIYANQGGTQNIHIRQELARARSRAGWWVLAMVMVDVGYFFYGKAAYTGQLNDSGDLWRAGIALVLLFMTGRLIRRWLRIGR